MAAARAAMTVFTATIRCEARIAATTVKLAPSSRSIRSVPAERLGAQFHHQNGTERLVRAGRQRREFLASIDGIEAIDADHEFETIREFDKNIEDDLVSVKAAVLWYEHRALVSEHSSKTINQV